MTPEEKKKYISDIFKHCKSDSILIINRIGQLERLYCPFYVLVVVDVHILKKGSVKAVKAVKMSLELIDVYIIESKAYYHYNFLLLDRTDPNTGY